MKKIILFLGCCLLGWGTSDLLAQQGNVAAGGQATGAGGSVSYSIGQLNNLSATGNNGAINQGLQQPDGARSLCGTLTYDNVDGTVLNNCTVLLKQGNTVVSQVVSDGSGYYQFTNPETGTYSLDALSTKLWGSVNASDALIILKHFAGLEMLSGLRQAAADVNASGFINATDALETAKRFVGLQTSFIPGDWVFEHPGVVFTGENNLVVDFKGICYGDVDGSYVPPFVKQEPTLFLENQGVQTLDNNLIVEVPLRIKQSMNCAAVSLILNYPADELEILGVEAAYDKQALLYNTIGSELRIAWYTLQPRLLNKDEALLTLKLKLKGSDNPTSVDLAFELSPLSKIADFDGVTLENKTLTLPVLVNSGKGFTLSQNIPNPFSNVTQITYTLPEDGYIKMVMLDVVGKQISVLEEGQQKAGSHQFTLSGNSLSDGVYFYRMFVTTGSQQYTQTRRMVISR